MASQAARLLRQYYRLAGERESRRTSLPSSRADRVLSFAGYWGFNVALLISGALILGLVAVESKAAWLGWLKVGLGVILGIEGFLLASNWRRARAFVLLQLHQRRQARSGKGLSLLGALVFRLASSALAFLGLAWIAAGILATAAGVREIL
jgi:hypothetical protein